MRIVVTGGAGYIGSTLVPMLLAQGHSVHVVDSLMYGGQALLPYFIQDAFSMAQVDIRDREALARELDGADAGAAPLDGERERAAGGVHINRTDISLGSQSIQRRTVAATEFGGDLVISAHDLGAGDLSEIPIEAGMVFGVGEAEGRRKPREETSIKA